MDQLNPQPEPKLTDPPAEENAPAEEPDPRLSALNSGRTPLSWLLVLALLFQFLWAFSVSGLTWEEAKPLFALPQEVAYHFGARPNWSLETRLFATSPFIHPNGLSLFFAVLWIVGLGRMIERRLGSSGLLVVFMVSAVAGGALTALFGPQTVLDCGGYGGIWGLVGARLGHALCHRASLPRAVVKTAVRSSLILLAIIALLYIVLAALHVTDSSIPWELVGGLLAGAVLSVFLPARIPQADWLGTTIRQSLGAVCLITALLAQRAEAPPDRHQPPPESPTLLSRELPELGICVGVDPQWEVGQRDENSVSFRGHLLAFVRDRSPFDHIRWESQRQIQMLREGAGRGVRITRVSEGEREIIGLDGKTRRCLETGVRIDRSSSVQHQVWYAFVGRESLAILIYDLPARDKLSMRWVEESLRHFRFLPSKH